MSKETVIIKELDLADTKNGKIFISHLPKPYGESSSAVVSIAISLNGESDSIDWKTHIPYKNIDEVINALKDAQAKFA